MRARRLIVLALLVPLFITVCRDRSKRASARAAASASDAATDTARTHSSTMQGADVRFRARDTTRKLGPGDVQITNTDRSIELALIGDSVVAGLGERVRGEVQAATDTATVTGTGFGASIEKMVKQTVAGALSHQMLFPVKDISDVRYQDGTLEFFNPDGSRMHLFENTKVDGKKASSTFERADAERFIAAFHARKAAMGR